MKLLKQIDATEGLRLIDQVRRRALDPEWFACATRDYSAGPLSSVAGRRPTSVTEFQGNITDLIVVYRIKDAAPLVGKFFLPVVKTRPWLGFNGLDDRGAGIDCRMRVMSEGLGSVGISVPEPYHYDPVHRVLWMEYIGTELHPLRAEHWDWALPQIGRGLARVHALTIPAELLPQVENALFRQYLIAYPFLHLKPYLARAGYRRRWREFIAVDAAASRSLIHGDFKPHNICVTGRRLWFIDLERSNYANPAYDFSWLLCHLLIEAWDQKKTDARAPLLRFLDAYGEEYPVGDTFGLCVLNYLLLFLAYRIATYDILALSDPKTVSRIERALLRVFEFGGHDLELLIEGLCDIAA